jgi:FMN-dependent NADH-azoreductase
MREFFLNLLNNLDKLAGLKQLDKIYAVHGEDLESAKSEINMLLRVLENVSKQFPFIPNHEQEKIINQAVVSEQFNSLNGNTVYHWLAKHKDKYFKESHHVPEQPTAEPLTGEARKAKLDEWLKSLANTEQLIIGNKMSRKEIEVEGKEWVSEIDRKSVSAGYKKTSEEELIEKDLHIQYIRENYDPYTGRPKPTWISESEWRERLSNLPEGKEDINLSKL